MSLDGPRLPSWRDATGRQQLGGTPDVLPRSPMHRWGVLSRRPQRPVGGDILTAWPILRGMAKRSSHREPAPSLLLGSGRCPLPLYQRGRSSQP
jgi:hypothetical protein